MSVFFYNSLAFSADFPNSPFSDKPSSPVKNSSLPTFSDDNAEILAV